MPLIDVLEAKDIEQLSQSLLGLADRLQTIIRELRDETRVRITIEFAKKEQPNA